MLGGDQAYTIRTATPRADRGKATRYAPSALRLGLAWAPATLTDQSLAPVGSSKGRNCLAALTILRLASVRCRPAAPRCVVSLADVTSAAGMA